MSEIVIKVEDVGKQYHLGEVGTGTLSHDLNKFWYRLRGKQDPYLNVGEVNDRTQKGSSDLVWALKDINFDVNRGEVLGIIGKNGAGKSTLLKIMSRVTTPTIGSVKIKGRIASLLEVGTGFHPDLTGRDNIFLNGSILGMTKEEIKRNFDEIVDFSGVERYIDTPVKRYSSGMYVRLAFAVAAYLDPNILIVDEVLAVGDAEFQKKCLGKMKDVSKEGKTVLFVSHIIPAVKTLCTKCLYLEKGQVHSHGPTDEIIKNYLSSGLITSDIFWERKNDIINVTESDEFRINTIKAVNKRNEVTNSINISETFHIEIDFTVTKQNAYVGFSLVFSDTAGNCLFGSLSNLEPNFYSKKMETGNYRTRVMIPGDIFNNIDLVVNLICFGAQWTNSFVIESALKISAVDDGILKADYHGTHAGFYRPRLNWTTSKS